MRAAGGTDTFTTQLQTKGGKKLVFQAWICHFLFTFLANYKKLPWEELPGEDEGV